MRTKGPLPEPLRSLPGRCAGAVGAGDTRDVHAGLLEDVAHGTAPKLLLRGRVSLGCLRRHVLCTFLVLAITGHQSKGFRRGRESMGGPLGGALNRPQDYLHLNVYAHRTGQISNFPYRGFLIVKVWRMGSLPQTSGLEGEV